MGSLVRVLSAQSSRPSGLLTDKQAGKKGVGGEVLAYVW
jgi:ribosomal protein S8